MRLAVYNFLVNRHPGIRQNIIIIMTERMDIKIYCHGSILYCLM